MGCLKASAIGVVVVAVALYFSRDFFNGPMCSSDVRMDAKVVIVTGANTGIGLETAVDLVARGARVYLACRSIEKASRASREIQERTGTPSENSPVLKLDLSSLKSVREFVNEFKKRETRLDVLINNAGVAWIPERMLTEDGFEMTFGVNHLGHFLLTNLLLDMLKASAPSRVITVSSDAHKWSPGLPWDDLQFENDYSQVYPYCNSKLANILFSSELARKLKGTGVTTYSLHPGTILTEITRYIGIVNNVVFDAIADVIRASGLHPFKDVIHGAQTQICCAVDPELSKETGKYYSNCRQVAESAEASNTEAAKKLWQVSEKLVSL